MLALSQASSHTHLVVGSESIHVLLEHGCPQIFAEELEGIQLLSKGQCLPGQPGGGC